MKETYERNDYFRKLSLDSARMRFRASCGMVQTVRTNWKKKYESRSLACPDCDLKRDNHLRDDTHAPIDSQSHVLNCSSYHSLKGPFFDPSDDKMLAEFFTKVVNRRIEAGLD